MQGRKLHLLAAASLAALLAACGGGGGDSEPPKVQVNRVAVMGDSLADVGVFNQKFTLRDSSNNNAYFPVFPEIVSQNYGLSGMCAFYRFTGTTFTTAAGCTNYAVGGGRIVNPATNGGTAAPQNVPTQLAQAGQLAGTWSATDLILVDGGGNDAADLVGAYLGASSGAAGVAAYQGFLAQQLDAATIAATLPQTNGAATAAGLYMTRLADTYYNAIKAGTLDRGATKVAVLDIPDITLTPRFQAVLAGVSKANGAAAGTALQGAIRQWIGGFNAQLRNRVGADARVAVVPFNADFTDEVQNPTQYGLTNATQASCPVTGTDSSGLPTYNFTTCTTAALDAAPPAGQSAGWWKTWAFSDGFHPTGFGHQLLAASVNRALARAGWL